MIQKLLANTHILIALLKYLLLVTLGWAITSIVEPKWLVIIGLIIFVLFDLCAWALWILMRKEKGVHTISQQLMFYVVQVLSVTLLWIVVFNPSIISDGVTFIADKIVR
jgi:hypothetical protein